MKELDDPFNMVIIEIPIDLCGFSVKEKSVLVRYQVIKQIIDDYDGSFKATSIRKLIDFIDYKED